MDGAEEGLSIMIQKCFHRLLSRKAPIRVLVQHAHNLVHECSVFLELVNPREDFDQVVPENVGEIVASACDTIFLEGLEGKVAVNGQHLGEDAAEGENVCLTAAGRVWPDFGGAVHWRAIDVVVRVSARFV